MQNNLRKQSCLSLLHLFVASATTVGLFACFVSTAYPFSVGPLPGINCLGDFCSLATRLEQYEEVHQDITRQALRNVTFNSGVGSLGFSAHSLWEIQDGNVQTDKLSSSDHASHFDNAFLTQGSTRLTNGKRDVLRQLQQASTMTVPQAKALRKVFGSYLHTVQDFYAHSNYVNLLAPPLLQLGDTTLTSQPPFTFPCIPTVLSSPPPVVYDTLLSPTDGHQVLTSGYAYAAPLMQLGIAPPGQCAHGLVGNGIHKDWTGRADHDMARTQAIAATAQFAQAILGDSANNPDNVCMFMRGTKCDLFSGQYTISTIALPGAPTSLGFRNLAFNNKGDIVWNGYLYSGGHAVPFTIQGANLTSVTGVNGGNQINVGGINDEGEVAGTFCDTSLEVPLPRPIGTVDGCRIFTTTVGAILAAPIDIPTGVRQLQQYKVFLPASGTYMFLPWGMNNNGDIVGFYEAFPNAIDAGFVFVGTSSSSGTLTTFQNYVYPSGINDFGDSVGKTCLDATCRPFLRHAGGGGIPSGLPVGSEYAGINNAGVIVGNNRITGLGFLILGNEVFPLTQFGNNVEFLGINNGGQLLGYNGQSHFIATPVQ